jgi:hypothetical protein
MPNQPNRSYNSDDLKMLSRVLEEALEASINGVELTDQAMQDLSSRLGKVIMERFTAGESDPKRLKTIAIESLKLRRELVQISE